MSGGGGGGGGSGAGAPGGVTGGYGQIGKSQAEKNWKNLRDDLKRRESAPMGAQQFGDPQRYHLAGVAPGWFNPALNNQKQLQQLQVVEAQKRQERANRLNPPIIPPTRGDPISVSSGGPVTVPSGAFSPSAVTVPSGAFSPSTQGFRGVSGPPGISGPTINWDQPINVAPSLDPESWGTRDFAGQMPQYHPSLEEARWMGAQERAGIAAGLSRSDVLRRIKGANPWRRRIAEGRNLRLDDWGRPQGPLNPYPWVPPRQETPSYGQADPTGTPWTPEQHSQAQAQRTIYENNPHYESFWRERQQAIDAGEQFLDPWRPSNVPREVMIDALSTPSGPPQSAGLATNPLGLSIMDNPEGAYMDPSGQLRIPTPEQREQWALVRQRDRDARTANPYQPSMLPPTGPIPIADSGPPQPAGLTVRPGTTPPPRDQFGMPIRTFTPEQLDQQALTRQRMLDQMTEQGTSPFLPKGSRFEGINITPNLEDQARNVETFQGAIGEGLTPEAAQARVEAAQSPYQEPQSGSGYFGPKGTGTGGSGFGPKGTGFSPKGSGGRASTPSMQNALTATGSQNQLPITPLQSQPQSLGSRQAFSIRDQFINSFL